MSVIINVRSAITISRTISLIFPNYRFTFPISATIAYSTIIRASQTFILIIIYIARTVSATPFDITIRIMTSYIGTNSVTSRFASKTGSGRTHFSGPTATCHSSIFAANIGTAIINSIPNMTSSIINTSLNYIIITSFISQITINIIITSRGYGNRRRR